MGTARLGASTARLVAGATLGVAVVASFVPAAAARPERPTVGDLVYADVDGDTKRDRGEPGVKGIELTLVDEAGEEVGTVTTGTRGAYLFERVAPGDYTIEIGELPEEFEPLKKKDRTVEVEVGDDPLEDVDIALTPRSGSIGGTVSEAQRGVAGARVKLTGTDVLGKKVNRTVATGDDGSYSFTDLRAGTYEITTDGVATTMVRLSPGARLEADELARALPRRSSIAGFVWHDQNGNGTKQRSEPGIAGVKVTLRGTDGDGNDVRVSTTTDAAGLFLFDELVQGEYSLTETQPEAYLDGAEVIGSEGGTATDEDRIAGIALGRRIDATGYGFGETGNVVTGTVFLDRNEDGGLDDDEPGRLEGVSLSLRDNSGDEVATAETGEDGTYSFVSVPVGRYTVVEDQPEGYASTTENRISLRVEEGGATVDFGEDPGLITGVAWDDDARPDGLQANTELGIGNVKFQLLDGDGEVLAEDVTTSDGVYAFDDLAEGTYTVVVTPPTGDSLTTPDIGTDVTVDSDFLLATRSVSVVVGRSADVRDVDAGLVGARPDLVVSMSINDSSPDIGQDLVLSASVRNAGPGDVRGGVVATLTMPSSLTYLSDGSDAWTCTPEAGRVTCRYAADLPAGQTAPALVLNVDYTSTTVGDALLAVAPQNGAVDAVPTNNVAGIRFSSSGVAPTPPPGGGGLPNTGSNSRPLVWLALAMIAIGAVVTGASRHYLRCVPATVAPGSEQQA
jgi:LPXTG-motif cell wall-anchored protein